MEGKQILKKEKKSRGRAVYLVPSAKYGYTFEAPLECKETQAACSLRRLNRASFFVCVHGACSMQCKCCLCFCVFFLNFLFPSDRKALRRASSIC